jgi:xanthine dehydrogenase accessory factor
MAISSSGALQLLLDAVARGEAVALATVTRAPVGSPVRIGTKLVVGPEGLVSGTTGDSALDALVAERAPDAIRTGKTARVRAADGGQGTADSVEIYLEPYAPPPAVVICGAGHISVPLALMAKQAGFRVTVIDDRATFANAARFPTADEVLAEDFVEALSRTPITRSTALVLITRGHKYDWDCLRVTIDSPAFYIGMIGSRRRVRAALLGLERQGVPADRLDRLSAPIGLDIGSETPEEIAVAVLAEIILTRRGGTGRPISSLRRTEEQHRGD